MRYLGGGAWTVYPAQSPPTVTSAAVSPRAAGMRGDVHDAAHEYERVAKDATINPAGLVCGPRTGGTTGAVGHGATDSCSSRSRGRHAPSTSPGAKCFHRSDAVHGTAPGANDRRPAATRGDDAQPGGAANCL